MESNIKQIVNLIEEEKEKLQDKSIPLKDRELLYISLCENKILPLKPYLSCWCFTDRDSNHYIEDFATDQRGSITYQLILESCFNSAINNVPPEFWGENKDLTIAECIELCTLSDKEKQFYMSFLEALITSEASGVIVDW